MNTTPYVLAGADGSEHASHAVAWAAAEAARLGAELRLLAVQEPWGDPHRITAELQAAQTASYEQALTEAQTIAREVAGNLQIRIVLRPGRAAEVLSEEAAGAYALVVGSRGRGGFSGMVLGSTSLRLTTRTGVPVIVVPDLREVQREGVVVGLDGLQPSDHALGFAFAQARSRGTSLTAIRVVRDPYWFGGAGAYGAWLEAAFATTAERIEEQLTPWREQYPQVPVTGEPHRGHPAEALRTAGAHAELLVVGTRGHSVPGSLLLGSVGHGVLHSATCPVAVVGRPVVDQP